MKVRYQELETRKGANPRLGLNRSTSTAPLPTGTGVRVAIPGVCTLIMYNGTPYRGRTEIRTPVTRVATSGLT